MAAPAAGQPQYRHRRNRTGEAATAEAASQIRAHPVSVAMTPSTAIPPQAGHADANCKKRTAQGAIASVVPGSRPAQNRAPRTDAGIAPQSSKGAHSRPPLRNRIRETAARTENTRAASDCDKPTTARAAAAGPESI